MAGGWYSGEECDLLLSLCKTFSVEIKQEHATAFKVFTPDGGRPDTFLGEHDVKFAKLWDVFKMLLTISHGQASVERGYSRKPICCTDVDGDGSGGCFSAAAGQPHHSITL